MTEARPAFYALAPGGWRDYVTLLHPPYTAWHLSYVVIGACLAPHLYERRLAAALVAFFLAMGISAHALDELNGRPLQTRIPEGVLVGLTVVPLAIAVGIGIAGALAFNGWLLVFVAVGLALVPVYNLELFGGAIHNNVGFALAWGAFPLLTGYFACAGTISWTALLAAAYATLTSYVQRVLSTPCAPGSPPRRLGQRDDRAARRNPRAGHARDAGRRARARAAGAGGRERRPRGRAAGAPPGVACRACARRSSSSSSRARSWWSSPRPWPRSSTVSRERLWSRSPRSSAPPQPSPGSSFALEPSREVAVAAGGITVCAALQLGVVYLGRLVAQARQVDRRLGEAEARFDALVSAEVEARAAELERTLSRARADSLSKLVAEERKIGETRRAALAEREHAAGAELSEALAKVEQRVAHRVAELNADLERTERGLSSQLAALAQRQQQLMAQAESRLELDTERLDAASEAQRERLDRARDAVRARRRRALAVLTGAARGAGARAAPGAA